MPPYLALLLWFIFLLALLRFDPAKERGVSSALWVPVTWFFLLGSRPPSAWLEGTPGVMNAAAMEEGNPLDRNIGLLFIVCAFGILISRPFEWGKFFRANAALTALVCFALLSISWSDYPLVAFKRWVRDLGIYLEILVVLTDPRPAGAFRLFLRRLCFLMITLSVVLNKYFPELSRHYEIWTGQGYFVGVTTGRNMLGALCLMSGLYFFWDTLACWGERKEPRTKRIIAVNVAFFVMTAWLLTEIDSATSKVCLVLGCFVLAAAHSKRVRRNPALLTVLIPVGICLYLLLQFGFGLDIIAVLSESVGRHPDLTGRTGIWDILLSTNTNPLVGVGYESFFLGPRLRWVWERTGIAINEAHDGYLEVYLNLGLAGLLFVAGFLIAGYRISSRRFSASSSIGSLGLALWTILLFYNVTESALFNGHLIWVVFLLGGIVIPGRKKQPMRAPAQRAPFPNSHDDYDRRLGGTVSRETYG